MPKLCVACLPFFSPTITNTSQLVCVCPNARIPSMRDCGSVALSGHRSLHLPATRGGFQEMPQVVAVQEIPPDYNRRLYKDAAHWSTSVLSVKKKCRSVTLRLHLFILLVTIPVRCGPCAPMWSTTGRSRPCGRATQLHKVRCISCFIEHCLISYLSIVMCHGLLPWTFTNWAEIHSNTC